MIKGKIHTQPFGLGLWIIEKIMKRGKPIENWRYVANVVEEFYHFFVYICDLQEVNYD